MAEFCKACSISIFGADYKELVGITDPADWQQGRAACALCEGCGPIQVDPDGNCVSADCMRQGHEGHGLPWMRQGD